MNAKQIHIEKYDFDAFEKEQKPFTMIRTSVIQKFPHNRSNEMHLWIFLESLPPTWKPNKSHITKHFDISDRTYDRWMSWLNLVQLIEYRQNRSENGTFGKGKLVVLDGSRFSPDAEFNRTAKFDGTVEIGTKTAQIVELTAPPFDRSAVGTVVRLNDAHINTTKTNRKEKEKEINTTTTTTISDLARSPEPTDIKSVAGSSYKNLTQEQIQILHSKSLSHPVNTKNIKSFEDLLSCCDFLMSEENRGNYSKQARFKGILKFIENGTFEENPKWASKMNVDPTKPTMIDLCEFRAKVKGYEWVGEWIEKQRESGRWKDK